MGAFERGFLSLPDTDVARDLAGDARASGGRPDSFMVCRTSASSMALRNGGLLELKRQRLLQSRIENGSAGFVVEVRYYQHILIGELGLGLRALLPEKRRTASTRTKTAAAIAYDLTCPPPFAAPASAVLSSAAIGNACRIVRQTSAHDRFQRRRFKGVRFAARARAGEQLI